jgi:hypothetical protein
MASLEIRRLVHTERRLTARLTTVVGRSQSEQTPPDGIASISPARTGLDQGVTGERPTWLRTLRSSDLVRRVAVVDRLKLCLLVMTSGLVLSPLSWCPSGTCSSFALVSMHFVSFRPYVEVLDDAGTSDRVRHVATESTNRRSHEAQASDWHQNGILWIAHDVPKKEPLHLGSSGVTTKSGQLSATGGLYGNNDS